MQVIIGAIDCRTRQRCELGAISTLNSTIYNLQSTIQNLKSKI
ncbi:MULTISPECIES: hypothetical protein [unclassified Microcoleus]|nr:MULTISPECIES: hypothetical protein [unclassified Microcoleus]